MGWAHLPEAAPARDRVLTKAEWRRLWEWGLANPYPWGPFLQTLMLSAQRLNEVGGMQWREIEEQSVWSLPAARHKGKRAHEVPLSEALRAAVARASKHDEHVFSTTAGRPIVPGSKLLSRIQKETQTTGWRYHDIRRTGATLMSEAGIPRFVIERVLGHADSGVTAVYDRHTYRAEKLDALERLAATVAGVAR